MLEGKDLYKRIVAVVGLGLAIAAFSILGVAMLAAVVVAGLAGLAAFAAILAYLRAKQFFLQRGKPAPDAASRESRPNEPAGPDSTRFVEAVDVSAEVVDTAPEQADATCVDPQLMLDEGVHDEEMPDNRP